MSQTQTRGFQCPECNSLIPTTIPLLLQGYIHCISCGLKLTVDTEASRASLEALRKLSESTDDISRSPQESLPGGVITTEIKGR